MRSARVKRILTHRLAPFFLVPISTLYWVLLWLVGVLLGVM